MLLFAYVKINALKQKTSKHIKRRFPNARGCGKERNVNFFSAPSVASVSQSNDFISLRGYEVCL